MRCMKRHCMCLYSLPIIQNIQQPPIWMNSPTPPAIRQKFQDSRIKFIAFFLDRFYQQLNSLVSCSRHYGILCIFLMRELKEKEPFFGLDLTLERFDLALFFSRAELTLGRKTPLKSDLLQVEKEPCLPFFMGSCLVHQALLGTVVFGQILVLSRAKGRQGNHTPRGNKGYFYPVWVYTHTCGFVGLVHEPILSWFADKRRNNSFGMETP